MKIGTNLTSGDPNGRQIPVTEVGNPLAERARWHRRAAALPLFYLAGLVVVGLIHPFLPVWRWTAIHLLLLGAVTNAIVVWSAHFTSAVLRVPAVAHRRAETIRLVLLNVGVVGVLTGGAAGLPWVGVAGATAVFGAVVAHLGWLARRLRNALAGRFAITVRYYLAAAVALLVGIPVGAWMLVVDDATRPRLLLFHAHVNLLGWVTLTVLGTLLTFWPTVLRTRIVDYAVGAAKTALPVALAGLTLLGTGLLTWWRPVAVGGLLIFLAAVLIVLRPAFAEARGKPPVSFPAWSIAAAAGWLLGTLILGGVLLATAADAATAADRFGLMLIPLLVGFVGQVLLGALTYLLAMVLGGGPERQRWRGAILERHGAQRVTMTNVALLVFVLPTPPYVRITTSLLILAALVQFLVVAVRVLRGNRAAQPAESQPAESQPAAPRPTGPRVPTPRIAPGLAAGLALVLFAVLTGVVAEQLTTAGPKAASSTTAVPPTGHTTTVTVVAKGMRYHPARIEVPAGDRLIIELDNQDERRHDLVLSNGAQTDLVDRQGHARLDAGIIGAPVDGWCSMPGHRAAGMTLQIIPTGAGVAADHQTAGATTSDATSDSAAHTASHAAPTLDPMATPDPSFTARDATAPPVPPGRLHRIELRVQEIEREVAPGVRQKLWTFNGTAPGPVLRGRVGDTFDITLINDGSIDHGIDFHAGALAPDQAMRPIDPGQRLHYRFTATRAGIWMYHCSTMPMLHHIGNGMYGAIIIDPPQLPAVDREYVLVQSEFYLGGQGEPGDLAKMQAERPDAVVFNGYLAQYAHRPLTARPGERVRIWLLNAGPNRAASLHIVGAQFDTLYREGQWWLRPEDAGGAQVLELGPAAGGFVETVFPEPGRYPFVSHVMVDAERGARGVFEVR